MAYNKISIIGLAVFMLLACRKLPPCEEFTTVCTVTYPNTDGVFSKSKPLRVRAEIPYRATNSDGVAVDISRIQPIFKINLLQCLPRRFTRK